MRCSACGVHLLLVIFFTVHSTSLSGDTIDRALSLRDGDTLVSAGGSFELGFFSPGGSKGKYVGIWFKNIPVNNIVWVANRRTPLNDSSGVLKFDEGGNLVILDKAGGIVWSSLLVVADMRNPVAQLLESGNLVIRDGDGNGSNTSYLWQSFDEPGSTLIAGMRLSVNRKTGVSRHLTSWRSTDDPSPGNYTLRMDADKLPHLVMLLGSTMKYSSGAWNGLRFSGIQDTVTAEIVKINVVSDQDEVYYSFENTRNSAYSTVALNPDGMVQRLVWNDQASTWKAFFSGQDECDVFATCGPYGVCNMSMSPICQCPRGFQPKSPPDGSGRCARQAKLQCGGGDGFLRLQQVKMPDTRNATVDMNVGLDECRNRCARNCSCTAYARADVREGVLGGCVSWSGDVVDLKAVVNGQQELFLRVPASLSDPTTADTTEHKSKRTTVTVVTASVASGLLLVALCGCGIWMKNRKKKKTKKKKKTMMRIMTMAEGDKRKSHASVGIVGEDAELPLLDFETIASATDNFSFRNKVGEGGFGDVYKGILDDGQEVAVKRLSGISLQGVNEFMNEARLIAKLQHKNLVRLLGCCIRGKERMLIYEFMQNKSLDSFIFDQSKHALLDWKKRLDIILGIAKGLTYLHHDSRFKIIHRDLKASNILLDEAMTPKISDFGTARIFGADQNVENTKRVIGTYGYMSPEYVINGIISVKSDVFSFGVLTLEILSGAKNRGIYENEPHLNLLSHAWRLWQEGNCLELLDATMDSSCHATQIMRCIQVGLLCVQERSIDRPTMSTVVMMLASENFPLPQPKKPGFLILRSCNSTEVFSSSRQELTENAITITVIEGR